MKNRMMCALVATGALTGAGCRSIESTLLHQSGHNAPWEKEKCVKGVPITLSVVTHVRLQVIEKHFLTIADEKVKRVPLDVVLRDVQHELIKTDKIFTVDFKRPAAGTLKIDADFEGQYFKKIKTEVDDQTLARINDLLGTVLPALTGRQAANTDGIPGKGVDAAIKEVDSVVAIGVFEVADPQFEEKVRAFLECHVNKGHTASVVPPGVVQPTLLPVLDQCPDAGCLAPVTPILPPQHVQPAGGAR